MGVRIALCVDEATRLDPGIIGLDGEVFGGQSWLDVFTSADEARKAVGVDTSLTEAWVVSSDDVEPINLAATFKADRPDLHVCLVVDHGDGSLLSRAHTALIDDVVDGVAFVRRFSEAKRGSANPQADFPASSMAVRDPSAKTGRALLLPIVSGSGGAGKSSVAVMSAFIAQSKGYRTVLLDYDLQFGDMAAMAGVEDALAIDEAARRPELLDRELRRAGLVVLAAPARLEDAEEVVRSMPGFLDRLSSACDIVVANTGAAWAEQHAVLLERSSSALFLIDQRASSVRACRHALELCARCGIASGPFQFAVNRCSKAAPLTSADVSSALQGAPVFELKDGGRDVEDYLGAGNASDLLDLRNDFCVSLANVLTRLLPGNGGLSERFSDDGVKRAAPRKRGRHIGRKRGRGAS